ncbi:hypothetical protein [Bacillus norwichensis]|nr:hypothetical protein [Bacillus norwichensis]
MKKTIRNLPVFRSEITQITVYSPMLKTRFEKRGDIQTIERLDV